jgi:hypothetical protein
VRIRIIGTPDECEDAVTTLGLTLDVRAVSRPRPASRRRGLVRVYVLAVVPPEPAR